MLHCSEPQSFTVKLELQSHLKLAATCLLLLLSNTFYIQTAPPPVIGVLTIFMESASILLHCDGSGTVCLRLG